MLFLVEAFVQGMEWNGLYLSLLSDSDNEITKYILSSSVVTLPEKRKGVSYHSEIENTIEAQAQICS